MRMAHRLFNHGPKAFEILPKGSWQYAYNGSTVTWNTNIQASGWSPYAPISPGAVTSDGAHRFTTEYYQYQNIVVCANSNVAIDISKYKKITVKYNFASYVGSIEKCHIEMQPASSADYMPTDSDIKFVLPVSSTPTEYTYDIPSTANKSTPRKLWIKLIGTDSSGGAMSTASIVSITLS